MDKFCSAASIAQPNDSPSGAATCAQLVNAEAVRAVIQRASPVAAMHKLLERGLDQLPLPGSGQTCERWRVLAAVGGADLALAKLYEGHTDALAIWAELSPQHALPPQSMWGVWAAEGEGCDLRLQEQTDQASLKDGEWGILRGSKAWCSGAAHLSHALVTAQTPEGQRQLFAVSMTEPGVSVNGSRWQAVGMDRSASADVSFDNVAAQAVGEPGAYLTRPGFWHGGAGVAACWFGAAQEVALALVRAVQSSSGDARALRALALGRVSLALQHSLALLRSTAADIDDDPVADLVDPVRMVRVSVDQTARIVLDETLRALGPAPFCRNHSLAQLASDLPIFIRQCHGDADLLRHALSLGDTSNTQAMWTL